ncbi:hypothetical protein [Streptomyces sp. NPDC088182]|uniref:hypothetical protein n=1 Tax=Streptomyces sp. NPDC088182 TaxID=3365838 RepID=UPI00380C79F6
MKTAPSAGVRSQGSAISVHDVDGREQHGTANALRRRLPDTYVQKGSCGVRAGDGRQKEKAGGELGQGRGYRPGV